MSDRSSAGFLRFLKHCLRRGCIAPNWVQNKTMDMPERERETGLLSNLFTIIY
jgi:hypothetical protein